MIALVKRRRDQEQSQLPGFQTEFADLEKKLAKNDEKSVPMKFCR